MGFKLRGGGGGGAGGGGGGVRSRIGEQQPEVGVLELEVFGTSKVLTGTLMRLA